MRVSTLAAYCIILVTYIRRPPEICDKDIKQEAAEVGFFCQCENGSWAVQRKVNKVWGAKMDLGSGDLL